MRGVAAAPEGLAGPEWVELVDPRRRRRTDQGADGVARASWRKADDGLDASPAPAARLAALRAELKRRGLDGFVVPRADEHQGEYVPRRSQRLAWLTGFSGSAGLAIVLADRAAIFIDGRYTLAVRAQVDTDAFVPHQIPEESPEAWIAENLPKGGKLGFDPWLQTVDGHDRFARACQRAGGELRAGRIQSRRRGVARPAAAAAGAGAAASRRVRRREQRSQARAHRRHRQGQGRRRGADHRSPIRSPGCSTCAAATCRARRSRWASRCCTATAMSTSTWTAARCRTARVAWLGNAVTLAPPDELGARARHAGQGRTRRC